MEAWVEENSPWEEDRVEASSAAVEEGGAELWVLLVTFIVWVPPNLLVALIARLYHILVWQDQEQDGSNLCMVRPIPICRPIWYFVCLFAQAHKTSVLRWAPP